MVVYNNNQTIVDKLLEFRQKIEASDLFPVLVDEASEIIANNSFAFSLASSIDRGTRAEIIWTIPYYLTQLDCELTPEYFNQLSEEDIYNLLEKLPNRPRYITAAPRTIKELAKIITEEFNGVTENIWLNRNSLEVKNTFLRIFGVGEGISNMILVLLENCFNIYFDDIDHTKMNVKPDVHLIRVFLRLGLIENPSERNVLEASEKLHPEFPGKLDAPCWIIGRTWCHSQNPQCKYCPMHSLCPKNIENKKGGGNHDITSCK